MSGIIDKLSSIAESIAQIPIDIINGIIEGITRIFVPDQAVVQEKIDYLVEVVQSMGIDTYDMSGIFSEGKPFEDITCTIAGQTVTIIDMSVVDEVVSEFKPVIRGFMWLMLVFYNFNQFLGLIGQQSMMMGGIISTVSQDKTPAWEADSKALQQFYKWSKE